MALCWTLEIPLPPFNWNHPKLDPTIHTIVVSRPLHLQLSFPLIHHALSGIASIPLRLSSSEPLPTMSAPVIPPGGTIVQTFKQSFVDVPVDADKGNAVATTQFLDAAESLTTIFGTVLFLQSATISNICVPNRTP